MARKKQIISLDIGSSHIKAVAGTAKESGIDVVSSAIETIPKGCYSNGVIKDSRVFEDAVRNVIQQLGVRTKNVVISYESSEIIKRQFVIPKVGKDDVEDVLAYEITNHLPIDIDSYILQHRVLEELDSNKQKVLVTAVPFEFASSLFEVIKAIGYNPMALDLHTNGIESLVEQRDETVAVVDMGYEHINISIFENGQYVFNRILSNALNALDAGLLLFGGFDIFNGGGSGDLYPTDPLTGKIKKTELTEEQIRRYEDSLRDLHKSVKVADIWDQYYYGDLGSKEMSEVDKRALEELVGAMDGILDEIEKVVRFQLKRSEKGGKLDRVLVYGGGALQAGMCQAIEKKLQIKTQLFHLPSKVRIASGEHLLVFVNAIAVIDHKMNFFKPFVKEKAKTDPFRLSMIVFVLLLLGGLAWVTLMTLGEVRELNDEIDSLDAKITSFDTVKSLADIKEKEDLLEILKTQVQILEQANLEYERDNSITSGLFKLINKQIPEKVFLTNINILGSSIALEGIGYDHQNIAQFVHNLRSTNHFADFKMGTVDKDEDGYLFSVVLELYDVLPEVEVNETR